MLPNVLSVNNLRTAFGTPSKPVTALRDVSFSIARGTTLALVGESGSGKSLTALSIMGLVPPSGFIESGSIRFNDIDLLSLPEQELRSLRGNRMAMIFQEPMTSLNPVLRLGDQLCEPLMLHRGVNRRDAHDEAVLLLESVGIAAAKTRMSDYPHQLSGGMRQRVIIAMAIACKPELLIADEPTTALDVTIQAQILELLDSLRRQHQMATLLITHDLGIVAERADQTCVMYAGQIVEQAPTAEIFSAPLLPYTRALMTALPQNATPGKPIPSLAGQPPSPADTCPGCRFFERCPEALPECAACIPALEERTPGHFTRCIK